MITAAAAAKAYHVEGVFFLLHAPGVLQRRPAIRPRDLLRLCHVGEFIRQDTRRPGAAPAQRPKYMLLPRTPETNAISARDEVWTADPRHLCIPS